MSDTTKLVEELRSLSEAEYHTQCCNDTFPIAAARRVMQDAANALSAHGLPAVDESAQPAEAVDGEIGAMDALVAAFNTWPADIRKKLSLHDLRRMTGWTPRTKASDWRIDTSAGGPILTYQNCSVIEGEQARYLLRLIEADQPDHDAAQGAVAYGVFAKSDEYPKPVLLDEYVGSMRVIRDRVMSKARHEGYRGDFVERMADLGWWVEPLYTHPHPTPDTAAAELLGLVDWLKKTDWSLRAPQEVADIAAAELRTIAGKIKESGTRSPLTPPQGDDDGR